jgi:hypothetical protein
MPSTATQRIVQPRIQMMSHLAVRGHSLLEFVRNSSSIEWPGASGIAAMLKAQILMTPEIPCWLGGCRIPNSMLLDNPALPGCASLIYHRSPRKPFQPTSLVRGSNQL